MQHNNTTRHKLQTKEKVPTVLGVSFSTWPGFRGPQKTSFLVFRIFCQISPSVRGPQFKVLAALLVSRGRFYGPGARKTQKTKNLRKPSQGQTPSCGPVPRRSGTGHRHSAPSILFLAIQPTSNSRLTPPILLIVWPKKRRNATITNVGPLKETIQKTKKKAPSG